MQKLGLPLSTPWLKASIACYMLAIACWLPVVWLQIRMKRMADASLQADAPLPALYWSYARAWELLGYPAFTAMMIVYFLMVNKPAGAPTSE